MNTNTKLRSFAWFFFSILSFLTKDAHAVRIVYFDGNGENKVTTNVLATAQYTSCMITVKNASASATQTYTLTVKAFSTGTVAGTIGATEKSTNPVTGITQANLLSGAATATRTAIAAGTTDIWVFNYVNIGTGDYLGANAIETQTLKCSGSIKASDGAAGTPGFLIASGSIGTMQQASAANALSGGGSMTGSPVFSQVPISVGGGRPF